MLPAQPSGVGGPSTLSAARTDGDVVQRILEELRWLTEATPKEYATRGLLFNVWKSMLCWGWMLLGLVY